MFDFGFERRKSKVVEFHWDKRVPEVWASKGYGKLCRFSFKKRLIKLCFRRSRIILIIDDIKTW